MPKQPKWTIEDNVVALYLALHGPGNLSFDADQAERIIASTLVPKKGFRMRVQNYRYVVTDGKEGLDAGYPDGFPPYRDLSRIFSAMRQPDFRDYVEMILRVRERMMQEPEDHGSTPPSGSIGMRPAPDQLVDDFVQVARLAGVVLTERDVQVEVLPAPHRPPSSVPTGKMAVYAFFWDSSCLKVGKVGPRSHARYASQHYSSASSRSNLAKSILKQRAELGLDELDELTVGDWIKANTTKVHFLMDTALGYAVLNLLEAFLQCRLRPRFEGPTT